MSTKQEIDRLMRQTQRYWYEDGFWDMGFGAFIFGIGLLFIAQALTPPGSPLWLVWGMGGPLLLVGGAVLVGRVVRTLKERTTWRRTGYVTYDRARGASRWLRISIAFLVSALVAAGMIIIQKNWLGWTVILGLVYTGAFAFIAYRFGLWRYLLVALWCLVLGFGLAPLTSSVEQSGALFHVGAGLALGLAGWFTWRRYNRSAPPVQEYGNGNQS